MRNIITSRCHRHREVVSGLSNIDEIVLLISDKARRIVVTNRPKYTENAICSGWY